MGIRAGLGNAWSDIKSAAGNLFQNIWAQAQGLFDGAVTKVGSIYSGGFIGIDANNWTVIKDSIETLITNAGNELAKFQELANRDDAIKGDASAALGGYLLNAQKLLDAYISTYRNFIKDAETALGAMTEGDRQNAQSINEASAAIEAEANSIRVD